MAEKLIYLGTERYLERRAITHEYHYYACGDKLEVRHKTDFSQQWFVTRYLNVSDATMKGIADKLGELGGEVRKSRRGHDELGKLLRPPHIDGFVEFGEEDNPSRKVVISSGTNLPRNPDNPLDPFRQDYFAFAPAS
jgi:hypothetical protein